MQKLPEQFTRERLEKISSWADKYGESGNVMLPADQARILAQIALAAIDGNSPVIPVGCEPYTWIEGREIPDSAIAASYDSGAGPVICAVAEVDDELQAKGYPALCWAYLDVVPGMMIDRATNCNITNHVVRWLPVKRVTA